jgi:DNA repair protein RecO (recombination protein O)
VNLDACELIHSHFGLHGDYTVSVALDFIAEVSEQFLPAAEVNERFFRLLLSVLEHLREGARNVWRAVTYFSLWVVRLAGFLPALDVCIVCGAWLDDPERPERAFFSRAAEGLYCSACRLRDSWEISVESRAKAAEMLKKPVAQVSGGEWAKGTAADLRHFLVQRMEEAIERRLITAPVLEAS